MSSSAKALFRKQQMKAILCACHVMPRNVRMPFVEIFRSLFRAQVNFVKSSTAEDRAVPIISFILAAAFC